MTFGEALKLIMQHKAVKLPEWGGLWSIRYNPLTNEINIFEADGERVLSQRIDEYLTRTDFEVLPDDKAASIIENYRRLKRIQRKDMFTIEPKRSNALSDEELNALYEELRPIVFRLTERLTKDDIVDINYEVGFVTFRFN